MPLPIVAPAPLVTAHADLLRDLFAHRCPWQPFQNDVTGVIVLAKKSLTHLTRCGRERADQTNLARFFAEAPWCPARVKDRRLASLLQQPHAVRRPKADAALLRAAPWCAPVGSLVDYGDRHDHQGDQPSPLAPNPGTSHDGSGPVRFPVDLRVSRRDAERTQWEALVQPHFPDRPIPTPKKERARLPKAGAPLVVAAPAWQQLQQPCRTQIARGLELWDAAMHHTVPCRVRRCDRWSLAEAVGAMARYRHKDWSSLRHKPRHGETTSFRRPEATGQRLPLVGPHRALADLVPLLPRTASQAVAVQDKTSWTFPWAGRMAGRGKVRRVVRCNSAEWPGTYVVVGSHRVDWSAPRISTLSWPRWPSETC